VLLHKVHDLAPKLQRVRELAIQEHPVEMNLLQHRVDNAIAIWSYWHLRQPHPIERLLNAPTIGELELRVLRLVQMCTWAALLLVRSRHRQSEGECYVF